MARNQTISTSSYLVPHETDHGPSSAEQPAVTTFPRFPELPLEIRLLIWHFCVPNCVRQAYHDLSGLRRSGKWQLSPGVFGPPLVAQVCSESRNLAMKHGAYYENRTWEPWGVGQLWLDRSRDTIYINGRCSNGRQVDPTHEWILLNAEHLYWGRYGQVLLAEDEFEVTLSFREAVESGLFGLWAEERIVVVDMADDAALKRFEKLAYSRFSWIRKYTPLHTVGDPTLADYSSPERAKAILRAAESSLLEKLWLHDGCESESVEDVTQIASEVDNGGLPVHPQRHTVVGHHQLGVPSIRPVLIFHLFLT